MEEKILTSDQVAEKLQIHPFTVLKFIKQGKLKASRLGRVYRIRESDVVQFLDDQVMRQQEKPKSDIAKVKKNQSEVSPGEEVPPSKEISQNPLHLGSESPEEALQEKTLPHTEKKNSSKKSDTKDDVKTDLKPDHYYILD